MKAIKPNGDVLEGSPAELREYYQEDEVMEMTLGSSKPIFKVIDAEAKTPKKEKVITSNKWIKAEIALLKKNKSKSASENQKILLAAGFNKSIKQIYYKKGYMRSYHKW